MNKTLKRILIIIVLGLLVWFIERRSHSPVSAAIKIGAVLPLSGDVADIGQEVNRGALVAVDEFRKQGINVEYLAEDDVWDPAKAVSASQKLTSINKVNSAFVLAGSEAKPMASVFDKAEVPLLVTWDSSESLKQLSPYIFSIGFNNEVTGAKLAEFMHNKLGLSHVAVVSHIDEVGDIMVAAFVKKFAELGGTVASKDRVAVTTTDFRAYISKIKNEKADGIAMFFNPPAHSIFAKQKQELSLVIPSAGPDITDSDIEQGGSAIEGTYMTYIWTDKTENLIAQYKAKFGSDPSSVLYAAFGYDAVTVLVEANKEALAKNISVAEALRSVKTDNTTTPVDMKGTNSSERVEKVFKIEGGKRVLIEE
ncbi:MAG: amino acid transporter substrate-binding protein branched-chain amino acid transport system [Parcubacteria group bacterium]|nr:amino acid transporter substrate-binding protein branched-chain amino acid transport system [Parcubacteria group bacterium]